MEIIWGSIDGVRIEETVGREEAEGFMEGFEEVGG